jgi:hypothetical protein
VWPPLPEQWEGQIGERTPRWFTAFYEDPDLDAGPVGTESRINSEKRKESMRKMTLLAVVVAMAALMLAAAPAMANDHQDWNDKDWNDKDWNDKDWNNKDWNNKDWNDHKRFDDDHKRFNDDDFCDFFDCNEDNFCDFFDCNEDDFDRDFDFDELDFDSDQDADSGNVDQTFIVTNTGDNSNQCVGLQGAANTGNAQDQTSLFQIGSDADDFDFDHGGSNIDMSPTNTTTCDQEVNQAATAYDGGGGYDYYNYYNYYNYYY